MILLSPVVPDLQDGCRLATQSLPQLVVVQQPAAKFGIEVKKLCQSSEGNRLEVSGGEVSHRIDGVEPCQLAPLSEVVWTKMHAVKEVFG